MVIIMDWIFLENKLMKWDYKNFKNFYLKIFINKYYLKSGDWGL